jgi:tetratricopeptide (TPR) repeat protein
MKRIAILLISYILISSLLCPSKEDFKISLIKIKDNYIAGEPILIKIIIENISDVDQIKQPIGVWYKESEKGLMRCGMPPAISLSLKSDIQREPTKYPPGYKWFKEDDLSALCGFTEPGNYKAYFKIPRDINEYMKLIINSDEYTKVININLLEPQGEDRKAYEEFGSKLLFDNKNWPIIRDKYPSSIYTGWVLLHLPTSLSFSLNPELLLEEAFKMKNEKISRLSHCTGMIEVNDKGEEVWIYPDEVSKRYINVASKFISAHPDYYGGGMIFTQLGTAYTILNQWQNAKEAYEKALKASWEFFPEERKEEANKIKEQIRRMINLLIEKKLAK